MADTVAFGVMGDASDRVHQGLRTSLERGEVEVSFGRAETREGDWILVSNSHLRWGTQARPIGSEALRYRRSRSPSR